MFVVEIDPDRRAVVIGPGRDLLGTSVEASEVNWLAQPPGPGDTLLAQIRHRGAAAPATVVSVGASKVEIAFSQSVSAITPGQSLVVYSGTQVIGGGVIDRGVSSRRSLPVAAA
jgi:tRNA-specific 2-thiouridylase